MPHLKRPREPGPGECCGNGCPRCVWDIYYDALATYEMEMKALENRTSENAELSTFDSEAEEEYSSEEETTESEDWSQNFIGSVVVRYLSGPPNPPPGVDSILRHVDPTFVPVIAARCVRRSVGGVRLNTSASEEEPIESKPVRCSGDVYVVDIETPSSMQALPGDVAELFLPNQMMYGNAQGLPEEGDIVALVCLRLGVDPDQWCELHRSPFVPENNFPPWLPLRRPITVRHLLTYYVDLSTHAFLHPSFFQSLLRLHENNSMSEDEETSIAEDVDLIRACASEEFSTDIIRRVTTQSVCYPTIIDALNAFSFVKVPLDRFLEISSKLRSRKFSVVKQSPSSTDASLPFGTTQLCFRETKIIIDKIALNPSQDLHYATVGDKSSQAHDSSVFNAATRLTSLLRAQKEKSKLHHYELGNPVFQGHVSSPLVKWAVSSSTSEAALKRPIPLYLGTSLFGQSCFSKALMAAVTSIVQPVCLSSSAPGKVSPSCGITTTYVTKQLSRKVYLLGMGTGMAPLMAAVYELMRQRSTPSPGRNSHDEHRPKEEFCGESTSESRSLKIGADSGLFGPPPFDCTVWYGARTSSELVFHEPLQEALKEGAIASYRWAISRSFHSDPVENEDAEPKRTQKKDSRNTAPESSAVEPLSYRTSFDPSERLSCVVSPFRHITDVFKDDVSGQMALREQLIDGTASVFACGPPAALKSVKEWIQNCILSSSIPLSTPSGKENSGDAGSASGENVWKRLEENRQVWFDEWSSWNHLP